MSISVCRRQLLEKIGTMLSSAHVEVSTYMYGCNYGVYPVLFEDEENDIPMFSTYDPMFPFPYYDDKSPVVYGSDFLTCTLEVGKWYAIVSDWGSTAYGMYSIFRSSGEIFQYEGEYIDANWQQSAVLFKATSDLIEVTAYSK